MSSASATTAPHQFAVVTGGLSGIGAAIGRTILGAGFRLFIFDQDEGRCEQFLNSLNAGRDRVTCWKVNLCEPEQIIQAFQHLRQETDRLDVMVNNAGIACIDDITQPHQPILDQMLSVNLLAVMVCTQEALSLMLPHRRGRIIYIASSAAIHPLPFQALYSATKAGILALARALRAELRESGITQTTICPGPTVTNILQNFPQDFIERHRVLEEPRLSAQDIARIVEILISYPDSVSLDEVLITPALHPL